MKTFSILFLIMTLVGTQAQASFVRSEWIDLDRQQAMRFQAVSTTLPAEKVASAIQTRQTRPVASEHGLWSSTLGVEPINLGDITNAGNKSLLNANAISAALADLYLQGLTIADFAVLDIQAFTFNAGVNAGQLQPVTANAVTSTVPLPSAVLLFLSGLGLLIARLRR